MRRDLGRFSTGTRLELRLFMRTLVLHLSLLALAVPRVASANDSRRSAALVVNGAVVTALGGTALVVGAAMFGSVGSLAAYVRQGKLRVLGVAGRRREPQLPDVPTMDEAGLKDFRAIAWFALAVAGFAVLMAGLFAMGAGIALPYSSAPRIGLAALPQTLAGKGSGILNSSTFLGGTVGVTAGGVLFGILGFAGVLALVAISALAGAGLALRLRGERPHP